MSEANDKSHVTNGTNGRPSAGGLYLSGTPAESSSPDAPRAENQTPAQTIDDPDAAGLPPGAVLPDRDKYRADQLRAQWINSTIGLVIVTIFWLTTTRYRYALGAITAAVMFYFILNLVRYQRAMSKVRMKDSHMD